MRTAGSEIRTEKIRQPLADLVASGLASKCFACFRWHVICIVKNPAL